MILRVCLKCDTSFTVQGRSRSKNLYGLGSQPAWKGRQHTIFKKFQKNRVKSNTFWSEEGNPRPQIVHCKGVSRQRTLVIFIGFMFLRKEI